MPFREPHPERFEAVANFRDLGGHRTRDGRSVRRGRLYRSGHLGQATAADVERLGKLGVRVVLDFRTPRDIEIDGADRLPPEVRSVSLPMADPAGASDLRGVIEESSPQELAERFGNGGAEDWMRRGAAGLVTERREPYAVFLEHLAADASYPALFHCSAGKDRAGWAASVVLLALGVPEEEVAEQYLLSNRAAEEIVARFQGERVEEWAVVLRPFLEVRREYFEASWSAVHEAFGDFDTYLREGLRCSEAQRERLRANLLE